MIARRHPQEVQRLGCVQLRELAFRGRKATLRADEQRLTANGAVQTESFIIDEVRIESAKGKGAIIIEYSGGEDLQRLVKLIKP